MHITVESTKLAEALKFSAAPAKSPLDILQFARLTASDGELHIETTDTEVYSTVSIPVDIEDEGKLMLHEATLRSISAGSGILQMRGDGSVRRGRSHYRVGVHPSPEDFPDLETVGWSPLEIPATALAEALAHVGYAPDDKDVRPYCRVVMVEAGRVWGTDGKVMARRTWNYDTPRFGIPAYQVPRLMDALSEPEAHVFIGRVPRVEHIVSLRVSSPGRRFTVRMSDPGTALNVEKLVPDPDAAGARVRFDRKALVDALRRFQPFSSWKSEKGMNFLFALELTSDTVFLSDRAGENVEHLMEAGAVIEHTGKIRVGLHPKQMISILGAIRSDQVVLHLAKDVKAAALIQAADVPVSEVAHVLMPFTL